MKPAFELPRPEPPETLSQEGRMIWREVVARFRNDWFHGAERVLTAYCQTVVIERRLADMVGQSDAHDPRWAELVRLYLGIVGTLARLATTLWLTPQSIRDSRNTKLGCL